MIVVITGATSGIGEETAKYYVSKGHTVYSLARRKKDVEGINYISCDLSKNEEIEKAAKDIIEKEGKIDLLINNAGMGTSGAFEYHTNEDIEYLIKVNITGLLVTSKVFIPYLRKSHGKIINISSVAGVIAIPFQAMYSLSKSAVLFFTEALRNELRPYKVGVTAVLPGDTKTGFTDARKKSEDHNEYGERINRSVARMEKDEQNGVAPIKVAKKIYKVSLKKKPNTYYVVGFGYSFLCLLSRILPKRLVNWIIYQIYGK